MLRTLFTVLFLAAATVGASVAVAQRTDTIVLRNGDVVTGGVKELQSGLVRYKTDSMSTVYVEWVDVVRIESADNFQAELKDGTFHFGALVESDAEFEVRIQVRDSWVQVATEEIIAIRPIEDGFWEQLDGSLSLGLSFTKGSDVGQLDFAGSAKHQRPKYVARVDLISIVTRKGEDERTTENNNLTMAYDRFLGDRWVAGGSGSLQQNDELGIKLRVLMTGTGGRKLVQTVTQTLIVSGGLAWNSEQTTSQENEKQTSLEGLARLNWSVFKYKNPKTDVTLALAVFPGITESGRVRTTFDSDFRRELVTDLFLSLRLYASFDNRPPDAEAATSDYSIVTSLGWTF